MNNDNILPLLRMHIPCHLGRSWQRLWVHLSGLRLPSSQRNKLERETITRLYVECLHVVQSLLIRSYSRYQFCDHLDNKSPWAILYLVPCNRLQVGCRPMACYWSPWRIHQVVVCASTGISPGKLSKESIAAFPPAMNKLTQISVTTLYSFQ